MELKKLQLLIIAFVCTILYVGCSRNSDSNGCACKKESGKCLCNSYQAMNKTKTSDFAPNSTTFGIDISHHNGDIDWNLLHSKQNLDFVYIKATEGTTHVDKNYFKNVEGAKAVGYLIGSYHFFRMTSGAHDQFKNFHNAVIKAGKQSLIPMVDVETNDGYLISELQDSLNVFISLVRKEFGVFPMIYGTNKSYNSYCGGDFNRYHLYIGRYGDKPPIIKGKGHYTIWQYSEKGKLPGIPKPVDISKFHPDYSINDIKLPD